MIHRISHILFLTALLVGCPAGLSSIEMDSAKYKFDKDYKRLEIIPPPPKEMSLKEVERLLGEPDHSPIDGQYYYFSAQSVYAKDQAASAFINLSSYLIF
ncbi:MAG: hypothetical protein GY737_16690 [Desulfobacteraceae bacterium]|nr:hypothetical protein [Desulfobacteraceae bacterium]